ncbi:hypothetical protein MMC07_009237 [Pseudocyphellaria aurata]|nr:hypothetical protein [Pseudocyphellaria aurata]
MLSARRFLFAAIVLYNSFASAVQPITVQGSNFVNSVTNDRFQIIGVAYQPGGSAGFVAGSGIDPLSNGTLCLRDAALMQMLGINTVRVYNLDPSLDHNLCASIFNAVGIYMLLDVNSPLPNQSLNPKDLKNSYNADYLQRVFAVVEAFHNFPNTLGFFSANEVLNDISTGETAPPYVRAVTRDLKNYIAKHSPRKLPVGYSAADVREILADSWAYFGCTVGGSGSDSSKIDFFGLNSYSWCGGDATFQTAGYDILVSQFSNTTIPVFFSEYGCNKIMPRVFDEVQALYGPEMSSIMSGGLVYEYAQEPANNFGLVILYSNGTAELMVDYDNLQAQYNKLNLKALESGNATATKAIAPACRSSLIISSDFISTFTLPLLPPGAQSIIDHGLRNPNNGKLVDVSETLVAPAVYSSSQRRLQNLAIKKLPDDESNTPDGSDTSNSAPTTASSSAGQPTPSKKSMASRPERSIVDIILQLDGEAGAYVDYIIDPCTREKASR